MVWPVDRVPTVFSGVLVTEASSAQRGAKRQHARGAARVKRRLRGRRRGGARRQLANGREARVQRARGGGVARAGKAREAVR